jgi:flavin reductase (DIM6/NTAB) family NADH-FMN oxidoreductase RutF
MPEQTVHAAGIDPNAFRHVLGHFPTGVVVVAAIDSDGAPAGMAVGSFTSVSLDPPLVAFIPAKDSSSFARMRTADSFCVNVLAHDQEAVCRAFATRGIDKFKDIGWHPSPSGAPILDGVVAWIDCAFDAVHEAGDHYIALGRVLELEAPQSTTPLLFLQGGYGRFRTASHSPGLDTDLLEQLHMVDVIHHEMALLSERTSLEALAIGRLGDELVMLGRTGDDDEGPIPVSSGRRLPFTPPLGTVFVAWEPEAAFDAWAGLTTGTSTTELRRMVDNVRLRGWSLVLSSPAQAALEEAIGAVTAHEPTPAQERAILEAAQNVPADSSAHEPRELHPDQPLTISHMGAPVFGADGRVRLELALTLLPERISFEQFSVYRDALLDTAAACTSKLAARRI